SVRFGHHVATLGLDVQRGLGDEALECPLRALIPWGVGLVGEQETALPQMCVEASGEMDGRTYVVRVLTENFAQRLAQRAPTGAAIPHEHERGLGLLVGMLHSPG